MLIRNPAMDDGQKNDSLRKNKVFSHKSLKNRMFFSDSVRDGKGTVGGLPLGRRYPWTARPAVGRERPAFYRKDCVIKWF